MKISKIRDVKTPTRANSTDAGIDFFIPNDYEGETEIFPGRSCLIPSGVKVNVPEGFALVAFNKSFESVPVTVTPSAVVSNFLALS